MNKVLTTVACLGLMGIGATAFADDAMADKTGGYGVGTSPGIIGWPGLSFRYMLNRQIGLEFDFGGRMSSRTIDPEAGDSMESKSSELDLSLLASYALAYSDRAALSLYGGAGFAMMKSEAGDDDTSLTDMELEFGLRAEYFFYEFFSIFGQTGISFNPYSDDDAEYHGESTDGVSYSGSDIGIFQSTPLGLFGFTFWMK